MHVTVFGALVPKRLQGSGCGRALGMLCGCCAWRVAPGVVAAAVDVRLWVCGTHPTPCWISSSCLARLAPGLPTPTGDSAPARLSPSPNITLLPANTPLQSRNPSGPFCCFEPFLRVRLASDGSYSTLHVPFPILDPLDPLGAVSTAIRIIPSLFVQNTNPRLSRHATSSLSPL